MADILSNRQYYKGGRATGPLRIYKFNTLFDKTGTTPEPFPLIFGAPVADAGWFRDISSCYNVQLNSRSSGAGPVGGVVPFNQEWVPKRTPGANQVNITHTDNDFSFADLQAMLLGSYLLVEKLNIQILKTQPPTPDGYFAVSPGTGFYPEAIGVWDGSGNNNYFQKISPYTYIRPSQGIPKDNTGQKIDEYNLTIPCEIILGPQAALVLDIKREQDANYCISVGMQAKKFTV